MKYLIQTFVQASEDAGVAMWHHTNWGSDDLEKAKETAEKITQNNKMGIVRVRVVEVLVEKNCENVKYPRNKG